MDEVDAPDVIRVFGAQTDDGTIFVIQPLLLFMALRQLQTFFPPQALNFLAIPSAPELARRPSSYTLISVAMSIQA